MFNGNYPLCPLCGKSLQERIKNYKNLDVDIAYCGKCDKAFELSYKIDKVTRLKSVPPS